MAKLYKRAYIEITNICNLNCSFCPIEERHKSVMSPAKFEKIVRQAWPLAEQLCLHLMGEPLAHPNFKKLLQICEDVEAKIQLTTNGLLLKRHQNFLLDQAGLRQVNISLQSYMDNFPNRDLKGYLDMIYHFIHEARMRRPDLYLNLRLWNVEENKSQALNETIFQYLENRLEVKINRRVEVGAVKSKKILDKLYLHFDSRFEWPRMNLPVQGSRGRCNALKDHIGIHADGTVVPCCLDDQKIINLGNCLDESLDDVINSPRARKMKEGFAGGVLVEDLCQRCSFINRFKK